MTLFPVNMKKTDGFAFAPKAGTVGAAGNDLYAHILGEEIIVQPGETVRVGTGISVALPEGSFGGVFPRSGLATKQGLRLANCVGVIDSDYRGEIVVALYNDSAEPRIIKHGDRIAQLIVIPFLPVQFNEVDALDETERGEGGFGSTGVNDGFEQVTLF